MDVAPGGYEDESKQRTRCLFRFSVSGDLRFISHHDTLRLVARALARASLPVHFSEGFNPHPRISIPLPRPVGVASDVEYLIVEFDGEIDPDHALSRLSEQVPTGLQIVSARALGEREKTEVRMVRYRLPLDGPAPPGLAECIEKVLAADALVVNRTTAKSGASRAIDIRPYLAEVRSDGTAVEFAINVTPAGAARPGEVAGLLGFDSATINHRLRRIEVHWD